MNAGIVVFAILTAIAFGIWLYVKCRNSRICYTDSDSFRYLAICKESFGKEMDK